MYFAEPGSSAMAAVVAGSACLAFADIGALEFRAVVRAKERARGLTPLQAAAILAHFTAWADRRLLRQPGSDHVIGLAAEIVDHYPLRAPDALQLASALALPHGHEEAVTFVCADARLLQAATREGLRTWNPVVGDWLGLN